MPGVEGVLAGAVLDAVDCGVAVLDANERVVGWNRWMAAASGIAEEEALGRCLPDIFPQLKQSRLGAAVTNALADGVSSVLTHSLNASVLPLKTRIGGKLIHNVTVRPIGPTGGFCLLQVTDVTGATERERVLRRRQSARYDAVVESAADAILTMDFEGMIQLANSAVGREFGYLPGELVGRPAGLLFQGDGCWLDVWKRIMAGEKLDGPVALTGRRKDGSETSLEVSAARWQSDSRVFVTAILRDVTQRRIADESLRNLNETLERRVSERTADRDRMWRLSADIMLVAHAGGMISATNPAWRQLLGWDDATLIGTPLRQFVAASDHAVLEAALADLAATQTPRRFELRMLTRSGAACHVAWSAAMADGLVQAVGRDVTAEREAQEALLKAEDALRQAQKMEALGQLTGGIAHDFNNLLTGIIGTMDMLKRRIAASRFDDLERFMTAASASAHRAAALTQRLLAFARRQPLDPQPLDVDELVAGMEELLRRSIGEQVKLDVRRSSTAATAVADIHQLENALLNLAINARDAMPHGGTLTIATENVTLGHGGTEEPYDAEPGDYIVISVSDTGVGMSKDVLAKVFDPFFTTKPIGQGTGLGLSMIYGLAKQLRGQVRIDSEVGRGTTVRLYLQRREAGRKRPRAIVVEPVIPRGEGETVLVVEDDPAVRLLIAEVLNELDYRSVEAADGQIALPILASDIRLDLMISDIGLPGMNGRELAEIALQQRPGLKVLLVTGYAEQALARDTLLGPGMDLVIKPFALDALALKIRELIGSGHA